MDQTARPDVYDTYMKDTFGAAPTDPAYHKQEEGAPGSAADELDGGLPVGGVPEQPPPAAADCLPNPTPDLAVTGSKAIDEGSKLLMSWDAAALKPNASDTDPAVIARGKQLAAAVQAERDSVTVNPKLKTVAPMKDAAGKMKEPGGLRYGGVSSPPPDALADPDPKKAALNQALWSELGAREGGVSAMNTWDTAGLTVGAGFAATGQLPAVLDTFLKSAPEAKEALMKVGFTCEGGKFMAVDPTSGKVCEGKAAIDLVKADPKVLSRMIEILEDPENAKKFADAEWKAIESMAGAVPKDVADKWDQQTIVMVAHYVH